MFWRGFRMPISRNNASGPIAAAIGVSLPSHYHARTETEATGLNARFTCFGEAMLRYIPDPEPQMKEHVSGSTTRWLQNAGGAELNITVSLTKLGWPAPQWISVVPSGFLGDHFFKLAIDALGGNDKPLQQVRREEGDLGVYHVWPVERKLVYQRRNSIFGQMDPEWFSERFWFKALAPYLYDTHPSFQDPDLPSPLPPLQVLHLTGITPLISLKARAAWTNALNAAFKLRQVGAAPGVHAGARLYVSLDLNHRPALGTFTELWETVQPHLLAVDLLVLSVGDCVNLAGQLGEPSAVDPLFKDPSSIPVGEEGAAAFDAAAARTLRALQRLLKKEANLAAPPAMVLPCKRADPKRSHPGKPEWQMRWSVVITKEGEVVSTIDSAVHQWPKEPIGGGDAWFSGLIDGLCRDGGKLLPMGGVTFSPQAWKSSLSRGDMVAALKQREIGDFSNVSREDLEAALKAGTVVEPSS